MRWLRPVKAGGIAAFIDAEHAFDRFYAQKLGVELRIYLFHNLIMVNKPLK